MTHQDRYFDADFVLVDFAADISNLPNSEA